MNEVVATGLSAYEREQIEQIRKWKGQTPTFFNKMFSATSEPVSRVVHKYVPDSVLKGLLDYGSKAARYVADKEDIKKEAGVDSLEELHSEEMALCDKLASNVQNWSIGLGVAGGAGTGAFGIFGAAVDVPILLTLALRTIHKVGYCYGYEGEGEMDYNFELGILSVAGANSVSEKASGLYLLRNIELQIAKQGWVKMAQKAAGEQVIRETGLLVLKNLGKQLGINLSKRKVLSAVPIIGAVVGGSVNALYIREVGWAAKRAYQERWLLDNGKITEI